MLLVLRQKKKGAGRPRDAGPVLVEEEVEGEEESDDSSSSSSSSSSSEEERRKRKKKKRKKKKQRSDMGGGGMGVKLCYACGGFYISSACCMGSVGFLLASGSEPT